MDQSCLNAIEKNKTYSNKIVDTLRKELNTKFDDANLLVLTVGSFARREASKLSDLDYFIVVKNETAKTTNYLKDVQDVLSRQKIRMPSKTGAFAFTETVDKMLNDLGGDNDTTAKLTRRILLLLESEWLYNEDLYNEIVDKFINRYVQETITEHQICRFFLNDLIRYYRTIGVDFEHKTVEKEKSWGDRNIKLVFSRKFIYFTGILVVAETYQSTCQEKRKVLKELLLLTPLERVDKICGLKSEKAKLHYDHFLAKISDKSIRDEIDSITKGKDRESECFRGFKNKGYHFSLELSKLLRDTYDSSHPIHNALKF